LYRICQAKESPKADTEKLRSRLDCAIRERHNAGHQYGFGVAVADGMRKHMRPALKRAAASGKPAVVNVITDLRARSTTGRFSTYRAV
jgi:hypothetical protein